MELVAIFTTKGESESTLISWDLSSRDTGGENTVSFHRRDVKKGFLQDTEIPI